MEVKDLELSVRTGNVLKMAAITTIEQFLALTKNEVRALPNAGQKTWNEIAEVQAYIRKPRYELADLVMAIRKVNEIKDYLDLNPDKQPVMLRVNCNYVEVWMQVE